MTNWKQASASALLALAMMAGLAPGALAHNAAKATQYVAFGDSLTVGWEPDTSLTNLPYGFVDRVYEQSLRQGRTTLANYGLGGLTSEGLKNLLQAVVEGKQVTGADIQPKLPDPRVDAMVRNTAKIKKDIQEAELITITIGGNDFWDFQNEAAGMTEHEMQEVVAERLARYASNVGSVLTGIHSLNKDVQIVIADQYNPVPPTDPALYAALNNANKALTATVDALAAGAVKMGMEVRSAHVAQTFVGKELEFTHVAAGDIHPNQRGYAAMAEVFANTIWGSGYKRPSEQEGLAIVVNGTEVESAYDIHQTGGVSYVPVREYADKIGANVQWDGKSGTITLRYEEHQLVFTVGSGEAKIDGRTVSASGKPHLMYGGKAYVPVRTLFETLGFDIQYVGGSNTVYINE